MRRTRLYSDKNRWEERSLWKKGDREVFYTLSRYWHCCQLLKYCISYYKTNLCSLVYNFLNGKIQGKMEVSRRLSKSAYPEKLTISILECFLPVFFFHADISKLYLFLYTISYPLHKDIFMQDLFSSYFKNLLKQYFWICSHIFLLILSTEKHKKWSVIQFTKVNH